MHIPTVTDQMFDKVLEAATSPVAVLFFAGDPDRIEMVSSRFRRVAEDFDDRVIFLRISTEENPTPAVYWAKHLIEIVVFRAGKVIARMAEDFTRDEIEGLLKICLREGVE